MMKLRIQAMIPLFLAQSLLSGCGILEPGDPLNHWEELSLLANSAYSHKEFKRAERLNRQAVLVAEQLDNADDKLIFALLDLARTESKLNKNTESKRLYERAWNLYQNLPPSFGDGMTGRLLTSEMADGLKGLAMVLFNSRDYIGARRILVQSIELFEAKVLTDKPTSIDFINYGETYKLLSAVYLKSNEKNKAISSYEKAIETVRSKHGPKVVLVRLQKGLSIIDSSSELAKRQSEEEEEKKLSILWRTDFKRAKKFFKAGEYKSAAGKFAELVTRADRLKESAKAKTYALAELAGAELGLRKPVQAEKHLKQGYPLLQSCEGLSSFYHHKYMVRFTHTYEMLKDWPKADEWSGRNLKYSMNTHGDSDIRTLHAMALRARILEQSGRYRDAIQLYRKEISKKTELMPELKGEIAQSRLYIAECYYQLGKFEMAEQDLEKSLEYYRQAGLDDHPDYARALALSKKLKATGRKS